MMPELDGYGVLHLLRKNPATEHIPFIFLTAKTERPDFRKGMEMGADDFITKPFDDIELLNAIEIRLKKYEILRGKYTEGEKGVNELLYNLRGSGLIDMKLENYESEQLLKNRMYTRKGKGQNICTISKQVRLKLTGCMKMGRIISPICILLEILWAICLSWKKAAIGIRPVFWKMLKLCLFQRKNFFP